MGFLPWPVERKPASRQAWRGMARLGEAWRGEAGHGKAGISIKRQAVSRSNHRNKWSI